MCGKHHEHKVGDAMLRVATTYARLVRQLQILGPRFLALIPNRHVQQRPGNVTAHLIHGDSRTL